MALVREVVECLLNSQKGEIALSFDNFDEAISRSKVEDGEFVRFTPGVYDPAVARFVFEVKGVKFVRGRDDPICYPKDEDDLSGVLSFARSYRFRELGYVVGEDAGRTECRDAILKAVSDIERKREVVDWLFHLRYEDFHAFLLDFEDVRKKLMSFEYFGYTYDKGYWRGVKNPERSQHVVGESVCAMGLMESLDAIRASELMYVDLLREDYEVLVDATEGDGHIQSVLRASIRGRVCADKVRLLLPKSMEKQLCDSLCRGRKERNDGTLDKLLRRLDAEITRWRRMCRRELQNIERRRIGELFFR